MPESLDGNQPNLLFSNAFLDATAKRWHSIEDCRDNRHKWWWSTNATTVSATNTTRNTKLHILSQLIKLTSIARFKVQLDVIRQLGQNIESLLGEQEQKMETLSRTDASKSRSTHIKLTRDYRWVETKFKNLQLEARQSWNSLEMRRAAELEDSNRRQFEQGNMPVNCRNKR